MCTVLHLLVTAKSQSEVKSKVNYESLLGSWNLEKAQWNSEYTRAVKERALESTLMSWWKMCGRFVMGKAVMRMEVPGNTVLEEPVGLPGSSSKCRVEWDLQGRSLLTLLQKYTTCGYIIDAGVLCVCVWNTYSSVHVPQTYLLQELHVVWQTEWLKRW